MAGKQNMSPKEIIACENYLKGMSLKKALVAAGYSETYIEGPLHLFRWLKRRHICAYIRQRQTQLAKLFNKDKAYLVEKLEEIIDESNPRDRVQALLLLERLVVPKELSDLKIEDVKGITININEAKPTDG